MTVKVTDTRHGKQLYFANDRYFCPLLETYGEYNYGEWDLFRQLVAPGSTVVDAGANIGCHTLALANIVGPEGMVMAFEPQRPAYYVLCGTVAFNEAWQVNAVLCALGAERGMTKILNVPYRDHSFNIGGAFVDSSLGDQGHDVPVMPLDDFDLSACHFVKIDVEGYEREVLLGARETIRRNRPLLYVENDRPENSNSLIEQLLGMEYRLYLHTPALFHTDNWRGSQEDLFPKVVSLMLLGVPAERELVVEGLHPIWKPEDMPNFGHVEI